ncbi:MAG: flagellar protein FlaG [Acidobacteriota bacterium]
MASIPSIFETSFDPKVSLLRFQEDRSNTASPRSEEPSDRLTTRPENAPRLDSQAAAKVSVPPNRAVTFRLDRQSERFIIEVVDRSTGEVVRQIPPEKLLELAQEMGNLLNVLA